MNDIISFDNGNIVHILKRRIKKDMFNNMTDVKAYRDFLHCDSVKQDNEFYYFLVDIVDVEYEMIDDIIEHH